MGYVSQCNGRLCSECEHAAARPAYVHGNLVYDEDILNLVTHSGVFHADDVFSAAMLRIYYSCCYPGVVRVARVDKWPALELVDGSEADGIYHNEKGERLNAIVFDIGMGKYDHHGERELRSNGVPYASFGKLWREYGEKLIREWMGGRLNLTDANVEWIANKFDQVFVQGIDAVDNGTMPLPDYPARAASVSDVILHMNPNWDSEDDPNKNFFKAMRMACDILKVELERLASASKARKYVQKALTNAGANTNVIVLEKFCPWQEELLNGNLPGASNALYIVYPSVRSPGCYKWQAVPVAAGSFEQRCHVPDEWCGKTGAALHAVPNMLPGAIFVHKTGFLGECSSMEAAIEMSRTAVAAAIGRGELYVDATGVAHRKQLQDMMSEKF